MHHGCVCMWVWVCLRVVRVVWVCLLVVRVVCVCLQPLPPVLLLHEVGHNEESCAVEVMCAVHPHHTHGGLLKEGLADGDKLLQLIGSGCLSIPAWGHGAVRGQQPTNVTDKFEYMQHKYVL